MWSAAAALTAACGGAAYPAARSPAPQVVRIWPGAPPGTEAWTGAEESADAALPNIGKVHVITNVTVPTLTVFRPAGKANGTAMVVVPGGAFRALPWDLDGIEVAHWLTAHGITAFVLKYRVRPPPSSAPPDRSFEDFARRTEPARQVAVADAEQAVRLVRSRAREFGVAPHRIGMIGFSAGAMSTIDAALAPDSAERPDFAASLYGALLAHAAPGKDAPPVFIAAAQDDPELSPTRSIGIFEAWTKGGAAAELHIYERGGHGFGFRRHQRSSDRWPDDFYAWLASRGLVQPAPSQRGAGSKSGATSGLSSIDR